MAEANVREPATESSFTSVNIRGIDDDAAGAARSTGTGLLLGGTEVTATATEINRTADISARVRSLTASAAIAPGFQSVQVSHATVAIEATIASAVNHEGLFIVKNTSASGTAAHTLTLTVGTFDGTNNVATLNAPGEALVVYFDTEGAGTIVENVGSVGLA